MNSPVARRHPAALLLLLLGALAVVGTIYALVQTSTEARAAGAPSSQTQVEQGRTLYLEGCSSCHGLAGEGTSVAPSLIGAGAASTHFQVSTGRMPMAQPSVQVERKDPVYDAEQTAALAAYVASLGPGPASPTAEQLDTTNADLARGGELFRTNCAQCHNFAGRGAALTEGKYAPTLMDSTPQQVWEAMLTGPQNMPVFGDGTLNEEDKQDILKYVEHLQAQTQPGGLSLGSFGPVAEGAFLFTLGLGLMAAAAIWIGAKVR
ncbi:MAG: c-type cytochrome [Candidatus Nanopelagicales bacterium]|nr:c-type cytochrome [Candidatus Nanopelagicales bacterium]